MNGREVTVSVGKLGAKKPYKTILFGSGRDIPEPPSIGSTPGHPKSCHPEPVEGRLHLVTLSLSKDGLAVRALAPHRLRFLCVLQQSRSVAPPEYAALR